MSVGDAVAKYTAEFVGTFLLVFTVGCNVIAGNPTWAATSIAGVLMVSIYAFGAVSGANFNPAVSVALGLSGKMRWGEVGIYCAVQLVAGVVAALAYGLMLWDVFNLAPSKGYTWVEAGLAEALYTCMLCFVVLNCAASTKNGCDTMNEFYGLAIGFVIVAGGYGAGHISGGCFNPAVALGIDVSSAQLGFGWGPVYILFELVGACLAVFLFKMVRPEDGDTQNPEAPFLGVFRMHVDRAHVDPLTNTPIEHYSLPTTLCSEFIGTYFLVLTVGLNVLGDSPSAAWSIAAALMCMVYSLGNCSGAHFNPAVTLAIVLSGRHQMRGYEAMTFVLVQILGGIAGAFSYTAMEKGRTFPLGPGAGFGWAPCLAAELIFTFVLCFTVLSVATVRENLQLTQYFGLAIGSCVTVGGFAIGAISGGSLNPAVSFGISTSHVVGGGSFYNCLIYSLVELCGAALAAGVFRILRPSEYAKDGGVEAPRPAAHHEERSLLLQDSFVKKV